MAEILAIDYGEKRVGVAVSVASFASPLVTLANDAKLLENVTNLIAKHQVEKLVIGLPRNLAGEDTPQTALVRKFAALAKSQLKVPVYLIDEAATSVQAEDELKNGKKPYSPGDIDSLAAAIILEDFLSNESQEPI